MRPLKASSFLLPLLFAAGCGTSPPNMAAPPDLVAPLPPDLSVPGCSDDKSCKDPTPHCDPKSGKCLACTADDHCPPGLLCANGTCAAGCSASHECGDAGVCDRDAGVCRSCMTDAECGDPANPCCDVPARKCVPCLPANDNCPAEKYCAQTNGVYACLPGCGDDGDCQGGPGPDAGVLGSPACCNHVCVDTSSDNAHCKTCGNACGMGKTCCAQACVDTAIDANHCGGCGKVCTLPNSGVPACAAAKCVIAKCKDGTADCDNDPKNGCEVNTDTDPLNCLGCGNTCVVGHGKAGCAMQCTIASCDNGFADCDKSFPNGCEIDITTTVSDCGGCAMACPMVPGATSGCALGACTIASCIGAAEDCNMTAKDGCEVDTSIDVKNCGGCAKNCPAVVQGTPGCAEGVCGIASCQPSFKDCNNNPADGCEVDSRIDVSNCGACGKVCAGVAQGVAGCAASACVIASCNAGYKDCNDNLNDGCEVGTNTDVKNCGACGKVCPAVPNGSPICTLGVCGATGCNLPYKDCDNNPANGCEVNTATDPKHCGLCNAVCPNVLNGTPGCAAGKCGIGVCNASFQDCNMNPADGCEINTTTDANNCNGCGKKCMLANATAGCANSACTVAACAANFGNCDKAPLNGCEENLLSDVNNCGACAAKCAGIANGTVACAAGKCAVGSCAAPFKNCNNVVADGCESNSTNDPKNCGVCATVCSANVCVNSVCPQCVNLGFKTGTGNFACPGGYRMPKVGEYNLVAPCVSPNDAAAFSYYKDVAVSVGGCNCKWNGGWCGQPSIETIRQGRCCGDYSQLHICIK